MYGEDEDAVDDATDEDIFTALPEDGVSIKVGADRTAAKYNLSGVSEVRKMFKTLLGKK